jgi:uncharacterized protein YndB with AHSA1/START domain
MIVVYIILGLIALILILAAIAGTACNFEKSIVIAAPLDKVWENVRTLHAINKWNPWMDLDPNMKVQYSGDDGTPGASFSWDSPVKQAGAGRQTILSVADRKQVATRVDFERPFKSVGWGDIDLSNEGSGVRVNWSIKSRMPYPFNIFKLFGTIEKSMDRDFGKGLNKLKMICEG